MENAIIPYHLIETLRKLDSIYEARLFGWVLAKAQAATQRYQPGLEHINVQFGLGACRVTIPANMLLIDGDHNYTQIKKSFCLANKTIDTRLASLNIIAFPELVKRSGRLYCTFLLHQNVWYALCDFCKGYRIIDIGVFLKLHTINACVFYLLISNQKQITTFSLDYIRRLTNTNDKQAYARSNNIKQRILDPAMHELDRLSPWTFTYKLIRDNRKYTHVMLYPERNEAYQPQEPGEVDALIRRQRIPVDERVLDYMQSSWSLTQKELEVASRYLPSHTTAEKLIDILATIKETSARHRPDDPKAYLVGALKKAASHLATKL